MTIGVIGNPEVSWLSWAVNWGLAYELPHYAWVVQHVMGFANRTKHKEQRRYRRELYEKIEVAIEQ